MFQQMEYLNLWYGFCPDSLPCSWPWRWVGFAGGALRPRGGGVEIGLDWTAPCSVKLDINRAIHRENFHQAWSQFMKILDIIEYEKERWNFNNKKNAAPLCTLYNVQCSMYIVHCTMMLCPRNFMMSVLENRRKKRRNLGLMYMLYFIEH